MPRRPDRRAYRDSPFLDEHARSQRQQADEPRGFAGLLRWYLDGFAAETPEALHTVGVWFGRPPRVDPRTGLAVEDIPTELVGGSQLGAPKLAEPMRQLLENSPRQVAGTADEEHYVRPMRAALARLAGRDGDAMFMTRFLLQVAYAQGDWSSVAARWFPVHPYVWRPFAEQALRRLYGQYQAQPPVRYVDSPRPGWVEISESQRTAVEAGERGVA